jgi:hypothetical protein
MVGRGLDLPSKQKVADCCEHDEQTCGSTECGKFDWLKCPYLIKKDYFTTLVISQRNKSRAAIFSVGKFLIICGVALWDE